MKKFSLVFFGFLIVAGGCSLVKQVGLDDTRERIEGLEASNRAQQNEIEFLHERVKTLEEQCAPPPAPDPARDDLSIKDQIRAIAKEEGYNKPDTLIALARCESSLNPNAVNDNRRESSYGLYQINLDAHPTVTKAQARDVDFSTRWTINQLKAGNGRIWTCWKKIHGHKSKKHRRPR